MTAMGGIQGAAPRAVNRGRNPGIIKQCPLTQVPGSPPPLAPRADDLHRGAEKRPGPGDKSGLLSRSVIRRFHGVWPLETPVTLFLPDSVASAVKPENPAVRGFRLRSRTMSAPYDSAWMTRSNWER